MDSFVMDKIFSYCEDHDKLQEKYNKLEEEYNKLDYKYNTLRNMYHEICDTSANFTISIDDFIKKNYHINTTCLKNWAESYRYLLSEKYKDKYCESCQHVIYDKEIDTHLIEYCKKTDEIYCPDRWCLYCDEDCDLSDHECG